ncbi:MAG: shikimate dehydrogenase [Rhizobiales bacterium]|nr:shikimate dehydrogenase [Hyphomicrobiales bacterium]MBA68389.1 shikimate dehydrogenase [Hyphomicrobiales bacterium]|tara:strand:+ start:3481 stop:4266 length:786 start_codon:yes stop_codon:yes gene_type:complete
MSNVKGGAVVTGAARGIGRELALGLLQDGFGVVIADVDPEVGGATVDELAKEFGGNILFAKADVTKRSEVADAIAACRKAFGGINVMINNAGFNKPEPFLKASEDIWRAIMDVNALGVLIGTQEAAKAMIEDGTKGKIINTASIAGRSGFPDFAPYSASKAAVISLTQAGARALAVNGITVNAFGPGVVDTPLWEKLDADLLEMGASSAPGEAMAGLADAILLGRVAKPADVVGTVRFLWSPQSDYMTGQVVLIDGGMVLQ